MLHEILLSLSGHPSPLLRAAINNSNNSNDSNQALTAALTPPERALVDSLAGLSDLHVRLRASTARIVAAHPSVICRAVAAAVDVTHLANFRRHVLDAEVAVLRRDAALVGAYDAVPLTALAGRFEGWRRRLEWLVGVVESMEEEEEEEEEKEEKDQGKHGDGAKGKEGWGIRVMNLLRAEMRTGYADVEAAAGELVCVAERTWLKLAAAWVLYGKVCEFGEGDFFVKEREVREDGEEKYACENELLPSFVTPATAASMLFIGRSLNQIRTKGVGGSSLRGMSGYLSMQVSCLAAMQPPIDAASFSSTIAKIRQLVSRTTLQRLLPLSRVLETLQLLRDFFLLGRGEFAMALTQQADEKIKSRWKRAENLAYEKRDGFGSVTVKEGEVAAVLTRTWAAMGSMQGEHAEEDEGLELARDLLRLAMAKSKASAPMTPAAAEGGLTAIVPTPFRNLLFSVPVILTMKIPSPLDLFLSQSDLQTYTAINSYLLSLRRAHIRLTDLWKITALRRHHPAPPGPPFATTQGGREKVRLYRERHAARSNVLRNAWATASAAIFFIGEIEGYLQTEVVAGLSDGFLAWLTTGEDAQRQEGTQAARRSTAPQPPVDNPNNNDDKDDIWLSPDTSGSTPTPSSSSSPSASMPQIPYTHDPQTLATAHRAYLRALVHHLLLTQQSFTDPLYELLVQIDHLVALVHRLQSVWAAADLEADVGVVDAFVDLAREERDVQGELRAVEQRVREGIEGLVGELRRLESSGVLLPDFFGAAGGDGAAGEDDGARGEDGGFKGLGEYVPRRVGGVDRLLMKLDFGSWFGRGGAGGGGEDGMVAEDGGF